MSRIIIDRPIFAAVVSIVILLLGGVAFFTLPITQYPDITPPTVQVRATYPGATPAVIAETVGQPIEQEVNGVEGMLYMDSSSSANGSYQLDVTFELGTDIDMATVLVQNRVSVATPRLPEEVRRNGVTTKKQTSAIIAVITAYSPDERFDDLFLTNFFNLRLKDEILRVRGVGNISVFPDKDYGMRVWLRPDELRRRDLTALDVVNAIREQNVQVAAGRFGQEPAPEGTNFDYGITTQGRLTDPEQFGSIIVRQVEGAVVRVRDVARSELGGKTYTTATYRGERRGAGAIVYQQPGSNAVAVATQIREIVERERARFPEGVDVSVDYDVSGFIRAAIDEVYETLIIAFILVALVVLVFLGNWRSALIPIVAIPVSLVGTFFVMFLLGFTLNLVTLLGLVLAIGIVVDDAIVVVENVERLMAVEGLGPRDATIKAMTEVTGPVVATTLVLLAVFIPASALPGISGQIYQQFALTIAISTIFSSVNALTMSPALSALMLRPKDPNKKPFWFNAWFDRTFGWLSDKFGDLVALSRRRSVITGVVVVALLALTVRQVMTTPTGFVPTEDQGMLVIEGVLPPGASLQRTRAAVEELVPSVGAVDGVASVTAMAGFGLVSGSQSNAFVLLTVLEDWSERAARGRPMAAIRQDVRPVLQRFQDAATFDYELPPIPGLGSSSGFDLRIQDVQGYGPDTLDAVARGLAQAANAQSRLAGVNSTFRAVAPQMRLRINRDQAMRRGVPMGDVFGTLSATLGTTYVNDFNLFGRSYQVRVSAEPEARTDPRDSTRFAVRSASGEMVPLGAFSNVEPTIFPNRLQRFNMYTAAQLTGSGAPGVSSGEALALMEQLAEQELPSGMSYAWSGVSYQEKLVGGQAAVVFLLGMLMVFLVLSAQYESWSLPAAVIGTIPVAVLGSMIAINLAGLDNNIFVQAGLVLLVGLAAKNAILIVEVAKVFKEQGMTAREAAMKAARQRFRPIMMTALSFILGVWPLVVATGAGAFARSSVGTAVFGGMVMAVLVGVLMTPFLFVLVDDIGKLLSRRAAPAGAGGMAAATASAGGEAVGTAGAAGAPARPSSESAASVAAGSGAAAAAATVLVAPPPRPEPDEGGAAEAPSASSGGGDEEE
ncbi:MAG: efflux RND transporter permease subunit [Sandaracinaceae bacterium]